MIDLHSHILPAIDDGARDLAVSLDMARAYADGGVTIVACTPHILPGVYHNSGPQIRAAVAALQGHIDAAGIPLRLTTGADVPIAPNLAEGLRTGQVLSVADSRYVLIEPPHHVAPARLEETLFNLMVAGYVPVITHPERLSWIGENYAMVQRLVGRGVWMQLTSGSLNGKFGKRPLYWSERLLDEGMVHLLASDAHDATRRTPDLIEGWQRAVGRVGEAEAEQLVLWRPDGIIRNLPPGQLSMPSPTAAKQPRSDGRSGPGGAGAEVGHGSDGERSTVLGGAAGGLRDRLRKLFG